MALINNTGNALSGSTGTGNFVGKTSATLITPNIGAATATSIKFGTGSVLSRYIYTSTFTPTFTFSTVGNLSVSYATQTGYYSRIGQVVFLNFTITFTPTYTTSSGTGTFGGFPYTFTSTGGTAEGHAYFSTSVAYSTGVNLVVFQGGSGSATGSIGAYASGKARANLGTATFPSGTQCTLTVSIKHLITTA